MKLLKSCTQNVSKFRVKKAVGTRLEKESFHSDPKEGNAKEYSNYCTTTLISHTNKVMLKSFKLDFSSM